MTLAQWSESTGIKPIPYHPTYSSIECGEVSVVVSHFHPLKRELWHLTDYVVSTAGGLVIWLMPRRREVSK